ncbi:hypothetical protein [Haloarcula sp. Atlit-7R]|uniref:hypothetical protein n=1 Tax=Haloarcula sp. Atlit-7R TaxID=2282125 RepID=UPI000EF16CF2|nr:hypothetical protein [Haloarcula sp. Atlit-7R]RLM94308.1 hypothetical protein D3D01_15710 [Haloarcula sp. Atlit-7R]
MTEYEITSTGTDANGKFIQFADSAPLEGITVDEAGGTVTFHGEQEESAILQALHELVAIERDRLLGYPQGELHKDPSVALQQAVNALESKGDDIDNLILPEDQEALNIE